MANRKWKTENRKMENGKQKTEAAELSTELWNVRWIKKSNCMSSRIPEKTVRTPLISRRILEKMIIFIAGHVLADLQS